MKRFLILAVVAAAIATNLSAHAVVLNAKFLGTVQAQTDTSFAVNSTVNGEFLYDTVAGKFLSFQIGDQSVASGFASAANLSLDRFSALYQAQVSPVSLGSGINSTFSVDLEGLAAWTAVNAVEQLTDAQQLSANLDKTNSQFGFYTGNADGSNIHSLSASLNSLSVSAVPEPDSSALMLLGTAVLGLGSIRRRLAA